MTFGATQRFSPDLAIRFRIHLDWELGEIRECHIAEMGIMATATDADLKDFGNFEAPDSWNPGARLAEYVENLSDRGR